MYTVQKSQFTSQIFFAENQQDFAEFRLDDFSAKKTIKFSASITESLLKFINIFAKSNQRSKVQQHFAVILNSINLAKKKSDEFQQTLLNLSISFDEFQQNFC